MTPLQLQLMERADKTLSFGCYILNEAKSLERYDGSIGPNYIYKIIGHPYGREKLSYIQAKTYKDEKLYELSYKQWSDLFRYVYHDNQELMLKPCIDRPEEGQKLVLDFLKTLPDELLSKCKK